MTTFRIADPLPGRGTTVLEASAGTGKTWAIAALVTRYVAEGVDLERILVITFGRAATSELRSRVREQLEEARSLLAGEAVGDADSELTDWLLDADPDTRTVVLARLTAALARFDAATITTTHGFCSLVLDSLGVAGDSDPRAVLVEEVDDLVREVVDDFYLRRFADGSEQHGFDHATALSLATRVIKDPLARLVPDPAAETDPAAALRARFGFAVRDEVERRKRRQGILTYDDLLSQLAAVLAEPDAPAATRMRDRWQYVLVDEFQDTDPHQWQVLDRAFGGEATMVLIGDPKQAIYAFRGGDVHTYLTASVSAHVTAQKSLDSNWRSDAPLVDRLQGLLRGLPLGHDRIRVSEVSSQRPGSRLHGAPESAPFRLRYLRRDDLPGAQENPPVAPVRAYIARDVALDISRLLGSGASYDGRPLVASDVAVIAHKHAELDAIQQELRALGIAAVRSGGSVFDTPAASEWVRLLEGLEQPHRSPRVRSAALTSFFGHTAVELDERGDELTEQVAETLREWALLLADGGCAAVLEAARVGGLPARVLGRTGGERTLTDLEHLGELLHQLGHAEGRGVVGLLAWLRERVADTAADAHERSRRLDSDAAAVQLVTIHGCKGLQYPVVHLPTLWDRYITQPDLPLFHDEDGQRCLDIGGNSGSARREHLRRWREESDGEWLRLLYVALTRAQSQVVCWWAPTAKSTAASPLHRVLLRDPGQPDQVAQIADLPGDNDLAAVFGRWGIAVEHAVHAPAGRPPAEPPPAELRLRRFTRRVDHWWRRTSYTALSRVGHEAPGVTSEPESPLIESPVVEPQSSAVEPESSAVGSESSAVGSESSAVEPVETPLSPMADLPSGATFGSLVHAVLEHADPQADDLAAELRRHILDQQLWWPVDLDTDTLVDALVAVCDTPLGPLAGDATLRDIGTGDRLCEVEFEVPLDGGDHHHGTEVTLGDLAPLLRQHLPPGDPVRWYADRLTGELAAQPLRGYLTGSIDVAMRVGHGDDARYLVVDYKTNWLGDLDSPLTADAYRPEALEEAMAHSDYPLQALLYACVLHRFLRWRLTDRYRPEQHLGGVLYLYLRGMCGPDTPRYDGQPAGVFGWQPPIELVAAVSDLLDGSLR
ncbi:UvrD-helicase domain-containing protein [Nocardioides limicola]|uniref:UvrD-helicase domain-containing protein n=1 Tax=Nocardioides limicola TaxID=2803368 RepID=UPI00193B6416|nr:UvrD-helicase domain-containing protein [Nocardioides sp. DJM-14]